MRSGVATFLALFALAAVPTRAPFEAAQPDRKPAPNVSGQWTGIWWAHPSPSMAPKAYDKDCKKRLDCTVVQNGKVCQATFEGQCTRQFKFIITMDGRKAGEAVLFKGTTDLGEKNGGIFDWIGRAGDKDFVGFFTSATHVGEFRLERRK
jgi:hypothetical protein